MVAKLPSNLIAESHMTFIIMQLHWNSNCSPGRLVLKQIFKGLLLQFDFNKTGSKVAVIALQLNES